MKTLKKIISLVLTAAILVTTICVGTVTASAESKYSVKFYDDSKYYYIRVGGIDEKEYDTVHKNKTSNLVPYICLIYAIGNDTYGIGTLEAMGISATAFVANDQEKKLDAKGYFKYSESSGTYNYYFRMPKSNSNAKKYMKMADDIDLCGVFFGLFDRNTDAMYYGNKKPVTDLYYLLPTVDYGSSSSSSSSKKKISSLEFDDVDNYTYTGKARKPAVTIYDGDYKLKNGTDYTLSYKNNKEIGEGTITVTGKGKYTGTKKLQFNIVPKKPTIKVSEKSGKITVSWGKITGAEKYQIYYSVNGGKYKKLVTTSKASYTTSKLDADDELKFKVRAFAEEDGENYYGSFSKAVTLK